jgi:hypothetical protein
MAEDKRLLDLQLGRNPHDRAMVALGWNTANYYLEEKFTSANNESMPCYVGIRGESCKLGFGVKCGAPACQLSRTAHVS